ncbi:DUF3667 domain-containing protein [Sphingomonas sp. SUN019]|uniref:DUF3667 domain-containing protein n=1 Tax=Sphingomonas sp. SUN019 TaxID=2937788 RepID=UPI00216493F8|nr:DUF3667 domain-containing protein [Sphingomonas sp. SUN019]UVO50053.1 DUF3667 domain-containing protein [Sphingomonas sp. SUN019]
MPGGIEAAGDLATGALLARSVEPRAGEAHGEEAHGACLNCGTPLVGRHCHACGQAGHVHRTMAAIGHDIGHAVFHFEGKIWHTLPLLALKPGELTRRYIAGERARFVSPIALFLFTVFLMFTVVANLPGWSFGDSDFLKPGVAAGMMEARTKLAEEKARAQTALVTAQKSLAKERADTAPDADRIVRLEKRVAASLKARDDLAQAERILPAPTTFNAEGAPPASNDNWLERKFNHAKENPKLLLYKVKTSAYKFSWALIPISLPFIWILFPFRRDVGMYDHAIFATYSLTFMSLLVIVLALLGAIGVPVWMLWTAAGLIPPFHIYRQLKGAYRLSRAGALWRTFWMLNFALVTTTFFVVLLIYLGVAD